MNKTVGVGRIHTGELDTTYEPQQRAGRNPVIYSHGAGGNGAQAAGLGGLVPSISPIMQRLIEHCFAPVAPSLLNSFGTSVSDERVTDAIEYSRENLATSNGKVVLMGASMGSIISFNYATLHPDDVACIVAFLAAPDMQNLRDTNFLGTRAMIDAAWGVTYPAALPAGASPMDNVVILSDIPIYMVTASDDVASVNSGAFAASTGAIVDDVGALGHTDAAIAAADISAIVSFIEANV